MTKELNKLNVSERVLKLDERNEAIKEESKQLRIEKDNNIKDILNLLLSELKEIKKDSNYLTYSKKAIHSIITVRLETKVSSDTMKLIKSCSIYLLSKSNLDFSTLSITKFNQGMQLINEGKHTRFKSNDGLLNTLKKIEEETKLVKANEVLKKKGYTVTKLDK